MTTAGSSDGVGRMEQVPIHLVAPAVPDPVAAEIDEAVHVAVPAVAPGPDAFPEELVANAVAGDPHAKARLLSEIHPLVLRYCRGRLGRQETAIGSAEDVAQDVCLAVVNALPTYRVRGLSFRAFVYGIAAHKVTDTFRAIGRNHAEPMAEVPDTVLTLDGPENRMLAAERSAQLGALLHRLTPRQREVFVLRMGVGLSAEQTAQAVRSTPGAVRVTQHRALLRLRELLVEEQRIAREHAGDSGDAPGMQAG